MKRTAATVLLAALSTCAMGGTKIGQPFKIPSDGKAIYVVLEMSGNGFLRTILTKRDGPSGASFAKREYNCKTSKVRYLGTGDTVEDARENRADPNMSDIVDGSIASYIGAIACE